MQPAAVGSTIYRRVWAKNLAAFDMRIQNSFCSFLVHSRHGRFVHFNFVKWIWGLFICSYVRFSCPPGESAIVHNQSAIAPAQQQQHNESNYGLCCLTRIDFASISPSNTRASNISSQSGVSLIFGSWINTAIGGMLRTHTQHGGHMTDHLCTQMV